MQIPPEPDPPLLYRHTAAGAVIAIVSVLAFLVHGTMRLALIIILLVLLAVSLGVFFHGHRIVGNIWKDHQLKKGRRLEEFKSRQWHPEIGYALGGTTYVERVLAVSLRFPKIDSVWREVLGHSELNPTYAPLGNPVAVVVYDRNGKEVCRCRNPQFNVTRWFTAVYPTDFVKSPPLLPNATLRFDWIRTSTNEVLASKTSTFDEKGKLELSRAEKIEAVRNRTRKYVRHLKQPL